MQEHLLLALLVVEAELVEVVGIAVGRGARAKAALLMLGERDRLVVVVHAADDHRAIRIAVQEIDDHLLPDAGREVAAPALAGPRLRHAHPAGGILVFFAVTVPMELHLDPAEVVGVDLLTGGSNHDGRLRAGHGCALREPLRPVGHIGRQGRDHVAAGAARRGHGHGIVDQLLHQVRLAGVDRIALRQHLEHLAQFVLLVQGVAVGRHALVAAMARVESAGGDQVVAIRGTATVALVVEGPAGRHVGPPRLAVQELASRGEFLHADLRHLAAVVLVEVAAGKLEDLEVGELMGVGVALVAAQLDLDGLEITVARRVLARVGRLHAGEVLQLGVARLAGGALPGAHRVVHRQRAVRHGAGVGQVHSVGRVVPAEPIVDAFVLEQAREELVVALLVLHAVAALPVNADHVVGLGVLEALERAVFEHRVEHFEHRLVLEDARIGALAQQPEPRAQRDVVLEVAADRRRAHEAHRMSLRMTLVRAAVRVLEAHLHIEGMAEHLLGIDRLVLRQHAQLVARRPGERLVPDDAPEHQVVVRGRFALDAEFVVSHGLRFRSGSFSRRRR